MNSVIPGFGLIFLAAVAGGIFALPLRMQRRYAWENTWFLAFLFALIIIPLTAVTIFLPVWASAVAARQKTASATRTSRRWCWSRNPCRTPGAGARMPHLKHKRWKPGRLGERQY